MIVRTTLYCANEGQDFVGYDFCFKFLESGTKAFVKNEILKNKRLNCCCIAGECKFSVKSASSLS